MKEPKRVSGYAFGYRWVLYPSLLENLKTLESEGAIYARFSFKRKEPHKFQLYRIKFTIREIYQFVAATLAYGRVAYFRHRGFTLWEALKINADVNVTRRVREYNDWGKGKMKDGTVEDTRGCMASFYPQSLRRLVCGGRRNRYQLLEDLAR